MPLYEIERKFLLRALPVAVPIATPLAIKQGYLCIDETGTAVRLRKKGDQAFLTVKRGQGLVREEGEIAITSEQFQHLWPFTEGRRLEKTRYCFALGEITVEVDVFKGRLAPLLLLEVEFADEAQSHAFVPPYWFGKEVTEDLRYSNQVLAIEGLPE